MNLSRLPLRLAAVLLYAAVFAGCRQAEPARQRVVVVSGGRWQPAHGRLALMQRRNEWQSLWRSLPFEGGIELLAPDGTVLGRTRGLHFLEGIPYYPQRKGFEELFAYFALQPETWKRLRTLPRSAGLRLRFAETASPDLSALVGSDWRFVGKKGGGRSNALPLIMRFLENGMVQGKGCNYLQGAYFIGDPNRLRFEGLWWTAQECGGRQAGEPLLRSVLPQVDSYERRGSQLLLFSSALGRRLLFEAAAQN